MNPKLQALLNKLSTTRVALARSNAAYRTTNNRLELSARKRPDAAKESNEPRRF